MSFNSMYSTTFRQDGDETPQERSDTPQHYKSTAHGSP